jgi:hypothetical protein
LTSNDPRYLTATYTNILTDVLEEVVGNFVENFEMWDDETNKKLREQIINPNFAEEERERLAQEIQNLFGKQ